MDSVPKALNAVLRSQKVTGKPLAIIAAGSNGSGKTTCWYKFFSDVTQMPLFNADRLILSTLPPVDPLPDWAAALRDRDPLWMQVGQKGVESFVGHAMVRKIPFAMETVFSHWREFPDGKIESKIDLIKNMQAAGYYVLLLFVGLTNHAMSVVRVQARVQLGGHDVPEVKLKVRFPRTQKAIREALKIVDASILTDNSREQKRAFSVCRVQIGKQVYFDYRKASPEQDPVILNWLNVVDPQPFCRA